MVRTEKGPLSRRQRMVLDAIVAHMKETNCQPTYFELSQRCKLGVQSIRRYINLLEEKGYIFRNNHKRPPHIVVLS